MTMFPSVDRKEVRQENAAFPHEFVYKFWLLKIATAMFDICLIRMNFLKKITTDKIAKWFFTIGYGIKERKTGHYIKVLV